MICVVVSIWSGYNYKLFKIQINHESIVFSIKIMFRKETKTKCCTISVNSIIHMFHIVSIPINPITLLPTHEISMQYPKTVQLRSKCITGNMKPKWPEFPSHHQEFELHGSAISAIAVSQLPPLDVEVHQTVKIQLMVAGDLYCRITNTPYPWCKCLGLII